MSTGATVSIVLALAIAIASLGGAPAVAHTDFRREARVDGNCSGRSGWRLTAEARDGGVEVEFEVSSSRGRRARGGWKRTDRRLARHSPVSRIRVRVVSTEKTRPCRSASISQARVGPKSP